MPSLLDEIVNAEALAFQQRQNNRALAGGSRDGLSVWDDGSLFINAPAADDETDKTPSEADKLLVKNAMNGDRAARAELELRAALGDKDALHALVVMDQYNNKSNSIKVPSGNVGARSDGGGKTGNGEKPRSSISPETMKAAYYGDKDALNQVRTAIENGEQVDVKPFTGNGKGGGRSGGGGGGGGGKKPYKNIKDNPSSIPHSKGTGASYENSSSDEADLPGDFSSLPPVKSSVKPPPAPRKQVHAYGDKDNPMGNAYGKDQHGNAQFYGTGQAGGGDPGTGAQAKAWA